MTTCVFAYVIKFLVIMDFTNMVMIFFFDTYRRRKIRRNVSLFYASWSVRVRRDDPSR
ncbi:hypothetical protein C2G38_2080722 [Gigaspora rosea]|uniref:Uncharacterized protein n=1 Tax=Gigaspora rosea TaxID=44941 RepID=A0A397VEQ9_9GLOM|nr:hypothetical protein C2G38_2080722 [Gigaspora rosea]